MTTIEVAREFDRLDQPIEAAWAYEIAITEPAAQLEIYIDLVAVYLNCLDFGYQSAKKLPDAFTSCASDRIDAVLRSAELKFGPRTDIQFWRAYTAWIVACTDVPTGLMESLAKRGDSLMPGYFLYVVRDDARYAESSRTLLEQVKGGETARKRWIRSVLGSNALRSNSTPHP